MPYQDELPVRLKGVGDSLWVTFDASLPTEELKKAIDPLFERLKHLAVNARVVLDPGGASADETLVAELGEHLKSRFSVGSITIPPEKPAAEGLPGALPVDPHGDNGPVFPENSGDPDDPWKNEHREALFIAGRVRSGQKIRARKHLVIMGDVNPGAEIIAGGDIIVMGTLMGTAVAGQPDNESAVITALDFRPTQIQIGGLAAAPDGESAGDGKKPECAKIENNRIVIFDYMRDNPFKRLSRPEAR